MSTEMVDCWKVTLAVEKGGVAELKSEIEPEIVEIGGDGYIKTFNGMRVKFVPVKMFIGFEFELITATKNEN
ncbi:hypothetical protein VPH209E381_0009 [Vibrio phage 209E38-1]